MAIERLSFDLYSKYNAIELAIHLARYSIVRNLCQEIDVLDVACGEGYGSYAMASLWGAKSVVGVDISKDSIENAKKIFFHPNVEFITAEAEEISNLFADKSFDLIVSLETIEHLVAPEKFLSAIKLLLKPGGTVIISCPNDHWYYGPGKSQNPYHLQTYYFNEFKEQTEKHLGKTAHFLFGRPVSGFGNFFLNENSKLEMADELKNTKEINTSLINTDQSVSIEDCSYFIGVWGNSSIKPEILAGASLFPISMDKFSITLEDENNLLKAEANTLQSKLNITENQVTELQSKSNQLMSRVTEVENWTVELQTQIKNAENRVAELETWAAELQTVLAKANKQIKAEQTENKKAHIEIQNKQIEIEKANAEIQTKQTEIERLLANKHELQHSLESSHQTIELMEESKFWKLRNNWVKLKDKVSVKAKDK